MSDYSKQDYAGLFMKMKNVMASIGAIEKTGRNTTQNYSYMESDVIVTAIRSAMIENNLAFMVGMPSCELSEIVTKNKQGDERITTRAMVRMDMMLLDCDTGCVMSVPFSNEALDTSDKAVNKAVTAAKKYWLIATFMVSTKDDDSDKDNLSKSRSNAAPRPANQPHDRQSHDAPQNAPTPANGANSGKFNWKAAQWWKAAVDMLFNEFEIEREHGANLLNKWAKAGHLTQDMPENAALSNARNLANQILQS